MKAIFAFREAEVSAPSPSGQQREFKGEKHSEQPPQSSAAILREQRHAVFSIIEELFTLFLLVVPIQLADHVLPWERLPQSGAKWRV